MLSFYLSLLDTAEEKHLFEKLYIEYRACLYKKAYGILKNKSDAEDAVHERFIILTKKMPSVSNGVCPTTQAFLLSIVRNVSKRIQSKSYREYASGSDLSSNLIDEENVEEEIISKFSVKEIEEILKMLPEEYYEIYFLREYMELSFKEIAESLQISSDNARKRFYRAKKKFTELLEEHYSHAAES